MVELADEVRDLQALVADRRRQLGRAEAEHAAALAVVERSVAKLAEFGVSTVDEAKTVLAQMEAELREVVESVRAVLDSSAV